MGPAVLDRECSGHSNQLCAFQIIWKTVSNYDYLLLSFIRSCILGHLPQTLPFVKQSFLCSILAIVQDLVRFIDHSGGFRNWLEQSDGSGNSWNFLRGASWKV